MVRVSGKLGGVAGVLAGVHICKETDEPMITVLHGHARLVCTQLPDEHRWLIHQSHQQENHNSMLAPLPEVEDDPPTDPQEDTKKGCISH